MCARVSRGGARRVVFGLLAFVCLLHGAARPRDAAAQQADTTQAAGAPAAAADPSGLKQPVQFSARDSLVITFDDPPGEQGSLYGSASVTYGETTLEAYRVDLLFSRDELRASGLAVDTGMVGRPTFAQGSETFQGEALAFNLRTERGRVVAAQTAIQDGFIRAGIVKVGQDSTLYVAEGSYTTCDCGPNETPSYSLRADKMKIVDGEWIYTGPIQLYLFNIPTPLWLPFGFLPAREGRRSGPLPPRYGEDERGFYLRDWGWYQAINEYMDLQVQFGLWTRGSWEINPLFRYNRRYAYSGQLAVDYVYSRSGEREDPDFRAFTTSSLRWTHSQTISPTANFNSNVNLSSQNYLRTVSERYEDRVSSTVQSSVNYSKRWPTSGRSLTLALSQRQVLATGQTDMTLPSLSFSQNARKPFASENRPAGRDERWYEKITYTYSSQLSNQFNYVPVDSLADRYPWYDVLFDPSAYRLANRSGASTPFNFSAAHRINSNASFTVNRLPLLDVPFLLNVSPSVSYTENWYVQTTRREVTPDSQVVTRTADDWLALRQFSTGVTANTTFYGMFPLRVGRFQGLRHTVRPNLSFTYRPDFSSDFWGYTDTYRDPRTGATVRYPLVSGIQSGRQQTLSLSVDNVFETKRVEVDTTGEQNSRVLQLLNLNASTSYNFARDSLQLAPLSVSARTRLFDRFDLRAGASFSPYATDSTGREIGRYLFESPGLRLARLNQFSLNVTTRFQSERGGGRSGPGTPARAAFDPRAAAYPGGDPYAAAGLPFDPLYDGSPLGYADFDIPWSLQLDFSYGYTRPTGFSSFDTRASRATINASFDFNLTPRWKVQGRTGYDVVQGEMSLTNVSILRDFECWEMSFNWVPFGRYQSYSFDLHVKSGQLRDLLRLRQPRSDVRGRFGSLLQ